MKILILNLFCFNIILFKEKFTLLTDIYKKKPGPFFFGLLLFVWLPFANKITRFGKIKFGVDDIDRQKITKNLSLIHI